MYVENIKIFPHEEHFLHDLFLSRIHKKLYQKRNAEKGVSHGYSICSKEDEESITRAPVKKESSNNEGTG